jgi:PEP-CTERM motif
MRKRNVAILTIGLALASARANASPVLVGFPPNGGVTLAQIGSAGTGNGNIAAPDGTVGRANTYTNFDPTAGGYSNLWWGPNQIFGPLASNVGGGTSQPFTLTPFLGGNEADFTGASPWTIQTATGPVSAPVRVQLKTFDLAGNAISMVAAGSVPGLAGSLGVVLDVTPYLATGFKADFVFQAQQANGSWVGVDQYFTNLDTTCVGANCVIKSFTGAFWQEATVNSAAVPEPASLVLFGTGVLAIGRRVHSARRRRA